MCAERSRECTVTIRATRAQFETMHRALADTEQRALNAGHAFRFIWQYLVGGQLPIVSGAIGYGCDTSALEGTLDLLADAMRLGAERDEAGTNLLRNHLAFALADLDKRKEPDDAHQ